MSRVETLGRLHDLAGRRIALDTAHGTFAGYVDPGKLGEAAVSVLVLETLGGDPSKSVVVDLETIAAVREA